MESNPLIAIFGAGSIGAYVGGRLVAAGARVIMVGRPRLREAITTHGMRLSDLHGHQAELAPASIDYQTQLAALADASLILVTLKSAATFDAAQQLAAVLQSRTRSEAPLLISLQNGLGNAEVLREQLPGLKVLTGMVPFNVVQSEPARFHQGTEGTLEVQADPALAAYLDAFAAAGLPLKQHPQMRAVQWAKLLLNLNNAVNALSDLPLKAQLSQRAYRRCVALAQEEALALLALEGIEPARLTPVPPRWIPRLLRCPDWLFKRLANRMLAIDPLARSSMWEDLQAGRLTEIDWLNGEVLKLAARHGRRAPINERLVELVHNAEQGRRRDWSGPELLAELTVRARPRAD
jgi:2-dehydropantoate 2-reductase